MGQSLKSEIVPAGDGTAVARAPVPTLPPVLAGTSTPEVLARVKGFYNSIERIFESWVARSESPHTRRAYRDDIMTFVRFLGVEWPKDADALLQVSVLDIQRFADTLRERDAANKTFNRRICSLSSFYKYLSLSAAELRLPIAVPNPASAHFIKRAKSNPREETKDLTLARVRKFLNMPVGNDVVTLRDRAILHFYCYTGARIRAGCRLKVENFHYDHEDSTVTIHEKGNEHRTLGLNVLAADAMKEYIEHAGITSGPLFRPLRNSKLRELGDSHMGEYTMYKLLRSYLDEVPGAIRATRAADGSERTKCIYKAHSLRASTATLLLEAGVPIEEVQQLLGHKHITTTQIYDKRRRTTKQSASHKVPF